LAIKELRRCVQELGFPGIQIGSHVNTWNLDAPELFPIFEVISFLFAYSPPHFPFLSLWILRPFPGMREAWSECLYSPLGHDGPGEDAQILAALVLPSSSSSYSSSSSFNSRTLHRNKGNKNHINYEHRIYRIHRKGVKGMPDATCAVAGAAQGYLGRGGFFFFFFLLLLLPPSPPSPFLLFLSTILLLLPFCDHCISF